MRKWIYIFVLFLGLSAESYAQTKTIPFDQKTWDRLSKIAADSSIERLLEVSESLIQNAVSDPMQIAIGQFFKGNALLRNSKIEAGYQEIKPAYDYAMQPQNGFPDLAKGRITRELGTCLVYLGRYDEAKVKIDESIAFSQSDPEKLALSYVSKGKLEYFLGNVAQSLALTQSADSLLETCPRTPAVLTALAAGKATIGAILVDMGDTIAISYLNKAENLSDVVYRNRKNETRPRVLYSRAMYHLNIESKPDKALVDLQQHIEFFENQPIAPVISAYIWRGTAFMQLNNMEEAWLSTKKALDMCRVIPQDVATELPAYYAQAGLLLAAMGRLEEARAHCDTALALLGEFPAEYKNNFFVNGAYLETWTSNVSISTAIWQRSGKPDDLARLQYDIAQTQKYFEAMRRNVTDGQSAIEFTNKAYSRVEVLLNALFLMDSMGVEKAVLQAYALAEQYKGYVLMKNLMSSGSSDTDTTYQNLIFGVYEVQTRLLDKSQTLIQYFGGANHLYTFVIRHDEYAFMRTPIDMLFHHEIDSLIVGISAYESQPDRLNGSLNPVKTRSLRIDSNKKYLKSAHRLYRVLLEPAEKWFRKGTETIIVTDGALGQIPFEALLTSEVKDKGGEINFADLPYWLNDQIVRYGWSATTLHLMTIDRSDLDRPCPCDKDAWDFVSFEPCEKISYEYQQKSYDVLNFGPVSDESLKIFGQNIGAFKNQAANIETFRQYSRCARYIFIPTHAEANSRATNQTFALFAPSGQSVSPDLMTSSQIKSVELCRAENVLLSACKTGVGTSKNGEGILSLGREFALAGAHSVTFTLWPVADRPSGEICLGYYQKIKENGQTNASALAGAKRRMYDKSRAGFEKKWAHPFYWAGFLVAGK